MDGEAGLSHPERSIMGQGINGGNAGPGGHGGAGGHAYLRLTRDPNNPNDIIVNGVTIDAAGNRDDNYYQVAHLE